MSRRWRQYAACDSETAHAAAFAASKNRRRIAELAAAKHARTGSSARSRNKKQHTSRRWQPQNNPLCCGARRHKCRKTHATLAAKRHALRSRTSIRCTGYGPRHHRPNRRDPFAGPLSGAFVCRVGFRTAASNPHPRFTGPFFRLFSASLFRPAI